MNAWRTLYGQHGETRHTGNDLAAALRQRLLRLATLEHCSDTIQGRFTRRQKGDLIEWYIQPNDRASIREPLLELPDLRDAHLTLLALVNRRGDHLHQFTAMIEGTTTAGSSWAAAVHLEDDRPLPGGDRRGTGACGHAALHCHVGPTLDDVPKVRVPFPAVQPADALDWLLSTVVPSWEPAPWSAL